MAEQRETIDAHWKYLVEEIWPTVGNELSSHEEAVQFVLDKVKSLASVEEGEEGKNEEKAHELRREFPQLKALKLLTWYFNCYSSKTFDIV